MNVLIIYVFFVLDDAYIVLMSWEDKMGLSKFAIKTLQDEGCESMLKKLHKCEIWYLFIFKREFKLLAEKLDFIDYSDSKDSPLRKYG